MVVLAGGFAGQAVGAWRSEARGGSYVSSPPSPATVEASVLARIDSQDTATRDYVNSFPLGATSSAMAAWINRLSRVMATYLQFQQECEWLRRQGFPRAQQRLDATLADLGNAFNIYQETYRSALSAERARGLIAQDAVQFATSQELTANAVRVAAAKRLSLGLTDVGESHDGPPRPR
jgi:hypothetical protein